LFGVPLLVEEDLVDVANWLCDAGAGWVLPHEDAGSSRRAERACRVGLCETGAALGEAVDVRRLVEVAAEATEGVRAKVVGKDEYDVWLVVFLFSGG
jgi:hypothetical protein